MQIIITVRRGSLMSNSTCIRSLQDFHRTKGLLYMSQISTITKNTLRAVAKVARNNNNSSLQQRKSTMNLLPRVVGEVYHKVGLLH